MSPCSDASGPSRRDRIRWSAAIFVCALVVRALEIWQLSGSLLFDTTIGDGRNYELWAREIVAGDWLGGEVFYQAPLYPYFLAVVYSVAGVDPLVVRGVQVAIGAASCVLLAIAGWRLFSTRTGVIAGFLLALYAPAALSDISIEKSVLDLLFVCLLLCILGGIRGRPRIHQCVALGASLGALTLTRENALVLAAVLLPWLLLRPAPSWAERLSRGAAFAAGMALLLGPVALRNASVGGGFHLTTSQFGPNFFIGNNAEADGTYRPVVAWRGDPRLERQDAFDLAARALGRKPSPAEVSAYFTRLALDYIRSQPGDWLALMRWKAALALNAVEMIDTKDQYSHADLSSVLRATGFLFHFGVLAPLALLGILLTWPERRRLAPLYLLLLAYGATLLAFYVLGRYRLPMVPILVLFAAAALAGLPRFLRRSTRPRIAACAVATVLAGLFCNRQLVDRDYMRSITQYNLGNELVASARSEEATERYREAIRLYPGNAQAHHNLGALYANQGDLARARAYYEATVRISPQAVQTHISLARTQSALGDSLGAIESYRTALRLGGDRADLHAELGQVFEAQGDLDRAIESFERALELDRDQGEVRRSLSRARAARAARPPR